MQHQTNIIAEMQKSIESSMQAFLSQHLSFSPEILDMLTYHLGWQIEAGSTLRGKRLRPLLLLLTAASFSGNWVAQIPAAICVELIHNFTLIHDDIQDQSEFRHGRQTLWKRWGIPLAINAGDTMFSLAQLALQDLSHTHPAQMISHAYESINQACLKLTHGQHLDISYENIHHVAIANYLEMVSGKTAALIAATTKIGALTGNASEDQIAICANFGKELGMAFQIQDDYLGIWGNPEITGKSNASDIISRKKSLPVVYALTADSNFAERWKTRKSHETDVAELVQMLEACGAREYTINLALEKSNLAQRLLKDALVNNNSYAQELHLLTTHLLNREK